MSSWQDAYANQMATLRDKSNRYSLLSTDPTLKELRMKTNLPDLQRWLDTLNISYV